MIGEMFDLEALAKQCEEKNRWSFFFMSAPMNVPGESCCLYLFFLLAKRLIGGIASLANALAIH